MALRHKKKVFVCCNPTDPQKTCRLLGFFFFFFFQFLNLKKKQNLPTNPLFFALVLVFFSPYDLRNMENVSKHEYMENMNVKGADH